MKLAQILALAQERIRSGQLPSSLPSNIWAGHGDGHRCTVCDQVISSDERQYEFALPSPGGQSACRLHFSLQTGWALASRIAFWRSCQPLSSFCLPHPFLIFWRRRRMPWLPQVGRFFPSSWYRFGANRDQLQPLRT